MKILFPVIALAAGSGWSRPSFVLNDEICAVPNVPCCIYYERVFDSRVPQRYLLEAVSEVGRSCERAWRWTPKAEDAGTRQRVVLNAWDDNGLVAALTTTVTVAKVPSESEKKRQVTLALLAASDTNCRYQDQILRRMRDAGFSNYRPVGSHTGFSASQTCDLKEGAPHDGFGGFTWRAFMTRYAFSADEIDNVQAEAEREQMKTIGVEIPKGEEWRKALLKSPLVRWKDGKKTVDVQKWFDRINGGNAPDYIFIELGGNEIWCQRPDANCGNVDRELRAAEELLDALRAAAPTTRIVVLSAMGGSSDQDGWAHNYGARQHCRLAVKAFLDYNRKVSDLCRRRNDKNLAYASTSQNIDPLAYPIGETRGNALHATLEGGKMLGDAIFSWLLVDLTRKGNK